MTYDEVHQIVKSHVAEQVLPGEDPNDLTDDVKLISDGIVDSLASLRLVAFLEERFGITVEPHEIDVDHLETLPLITQMVCAKLKRQ